MIKITLTPDETKRLESALLPTNRDIVTRKARVILYLTDGGKVKDAANAFRLDPRTIYRYKIQFCQEGIEEFLKTKPVPGRPPKVPKNIAQIINDALKRSPSAIDGLRTVVHNWTLELMRDYLEKEYEISISISNVWKLMKAHRIRHIYSRAIMTSPDPDYVEKRQAVEALKKRWKPKRWKRTAE